MSRPNSGIVHEPCTLVYTLLNPDVITFDQMYLIVRSLHSYMVESITPNPELQNVHVKLNFQASVANAQARLRDLVAAVSVTKLSSFIQEHEFSELEQLRRRFGIGGGDVDTASVLPSYRPPGPAPRPRVRGRRPKAFAQRPAPYPVYKENTYFPVESPSFQGTIPDNQGFEEDSTINLCSGEAD